MADLSTDIETNATQPKSATVEGNSVTQRSIAEMILAEEHLNEKTAVRDRRGGFNLRKIKPGGSV